MSSPALHLGHVSGSLDDAIQAMHDHLRESVLPKPVENKSFRVQYLVPADQGFYKPFDEASTLKCVDIAHAIGAELFLLDAYWWDFTCDWFPSKNRFPAGIEPVIDSVRQKGMLFGLYVEAEGGRGNIKESQIYKQHPEWFGPKDVLNLTIPAAAEWMESEICRLIETYQLDLYRIDYNPCFTYHGSSTVRHGFTENNYWRYYEVLFEIYERLIRKYPNVVFQQCAAGGARNDLGIVSRFHESNVTDGLSIPRELQAYCGLTLGLPPDILIMLHGADGGFGYDKPQNLDTVLRLTFALTTPQIFIASTAPSLEELHPERLERFQHYSRIYKEFIRPILPTCRMFHHHPVNATDGVDSGPRFAVEFADPQRTKGWAVIIRMRNGKGDTFVPWYFSKPVRDETGMDELYADDTYHFRPRGLSPDKMYRITFDSWNASVELSGFHLLQQGLNILLENIGMSELILFESIS
ncbi:alpha-galactosidase [candidate division KSB1 bacterium]|nr:alpha-galactosidase [candidate division KSB1 bacterium]